MAVNILLQRSSLLRLNVKQLARRKLNTVLVPRPSTRSASVYQTPTKASIPERLLIYHAGTGRIVFVGSLKLTTIFLFSATLLFVTPTLYKDQAQPPWVAPSVAVAGAVPLFYVIYYASPFVAYVHVKLPTFARRSREQLLRWTKNIPPNTELEMTTIKSYGSLRTTRMPIAELRPIKTRFGIENLIRIPGPLTSRETGMRRPWWASIEQNIFFVGNQGGKVVDAAVWQKALQQIQGSKNASIREALMKE